MTSTALSVIPQGASLVEIEPKVAAWIDQEDDGAILRLARDRLAAWRHHAEAGSAERDSAIRLDIRCERRLGQLPEAAPKPMGRPESVTGRNTSEAPPGGLLPDHDRHGLRVAPGVQVVPG